MQNKRLFVLIVSLMLLLTAAVSSVATLWVSEYVSVKRGDRVYLSERDFELWSWFRRLFEVEDMIERHALHPVDDEARQNMVLGAIRGMVSSIGDDYATYYTPEEYAEMMLSSDGVYVGIGVGIKFDEESKRILINKVYRLGPAKEAGVEEGDQLIRVNGQDVTDKTSDEISGLLAGEADTDVMLGILRDGEEMTFEMTRGNVQIDQVEYRMLDDEIGYIQILAFKGNASERFRAALKDLKSKKVKAIVLDLRGNLGGSVDISLDIADILLPGGTIMYTQTRDGTKQVHSSAQGALNLPMVVLINGSTASASEILAGAVQDYGAGTLVGEKTYGKGIVQNTYTFKDNAAFRITTEYYFTPDGRQIHGQGILPDVEVAPSESWLSDPEQHTDENDLQLQKAIELVRQKIDS